MAKLTGPEIIKQVKAGQITIEPFDESQVGPNSYDVRLGPTLKVYVNEYGDLMRPTPHQLRHYALEQGPGQIIPFDYLDSKVKPETREITIPENGLILMPGVAYLGASVEKIGTDKFVQTLHGRSSIARLFVSVHPGAGLGDVGWTGQWTAEITCVLPVRIYPNQRIAQICFEEVVGDVLSYADRPGSKYHGQAGPTPSMIYKDND